MACRAPIFFVDFTGGFQPQGFLKAAQGLCSRFVCFSLASCILVVLTPAGLEDRDDEFL